MKTNFSHIISAESHTDAASWIVQLSSDSPDINITLDPDQVYQKMRHQMLSSLLLSVIHKGFLLLTQLIHKEYFLPVQLPLLVIHSAFLHIAYM